MQRAHMRMRLEIFTSSSDKKGTMVVRKNRILGRLICDRARETGCSPFEPIDQIIDEMKSFQLPGEAPEPEPLIRYGRKWSDDWRLPRAERPRCGATRPLLGLPRGGKLVGV